MGIIKQSSDLFHTLQEFLSTFIFPQLKFL